MSEKVRQTGQYWYKNVRDLPDHVLETADLHAFLEDYEAPRDKIHRMLARGLLIPLKRGLFIKAPAMGGRVRPFEIANLLYGPSYVSFETALSYHGLIPERVASTISATSKRNKQYVTPVGRFEYRYLNRNRYTTGCHWVNEGSRGFLIATPEKALADVIARESSMGIRGIRGYLEADLRMDLDEVNELRRDLMHAIAAAYGNRNVSALARWLDRSNGRST